MKILLADDHPLFLDGLKNLLETKGYEVVGLARNGKEAIVKAREFKPDFILMDVFMPECDGIEATHLIKPALPDCKIIMLTSAEDDDYLFEAVKKGASGYLLKSLQAAELIDLLESLERSETIFSPGLAKRILKEFVRSSFGPSEHLAQDEAKDGSAEVLSIRQLEVLKLVAQGKTYKEAAVELNLTERTVKYHMGRILDTLHIENKAQAIYYAVNNGLLE